jgi:hypothetical protein
MAVEPVELIPQCEYRTLWLPDDRERRRAYLDTDEQLVFYCRSVHRARVQQPGRLESLKRASRAGPLSADDPEAVSGARPETLRAAVVPLDENL